MQVPSLTLSQSQSDRVRTIARDAYMYHRGNPGLAKQLAEQNIKAEFIATGFVATIAMKILVAVAVNRASKLITDWMDRRISTPSLGYVAGEPGYKQ